MLGYIGGIRPNKVEPLICSLTNKAAILMAFLTPDLQFTFQNIQQFDKKYCNVETQVTKKKVEMRATWNSSNGTKDPRMTIHKTSITFNMPIFCQIRASSSICARIILISHRNQPLADIYRVILAIIKNKVPQGLQWQLKQHLCTHQNPKCKQRSHIYSMFKNESK